MQEWWGKVSGRLEAMERTWAWLARRLGIDPSTLNKYKNGKHPTPERVRYAINLILGIKVRPEPEPIEDVA